MSQIIVTHPLILFVSHMKSIHPELQLLHGINDKMCNILDPFTAKSKLNDLKKWLKIKIHYTRHILVLVIICAK